MGWIDVEPSSTNFVVNTGQAMSRWTNDTYKANDHRVRFENVERISVPFFVEPAYNTPIESFTPPVLFNSVKYETIPYGKHVSELMKQFSEYAKKDTAEKVTVK
jgi:isopenicillin N synthase-like dioxygenase